MPATLVPPYIKRHISRFTTSQAAPQSRIDEDRKGFHKAIAAIYQKDHEKTMAILKDKEPGWEKSFLEQRRATMHRVSEAMPAMFDRYKHLLEDKDWEPRPMGSYRDRDFRVVILNVDKELGFFTVGLIFDPGQSTSPHTHKTLCFGVPYHGVTEEVIFDTAQNPMNRVRRDNPYQIEIASPENEGDLHAVGNPQAPQEGEPQRKNMAVQIQLYDGYDLSRLLEHSEIMPMITGTPGEKLSGARQSFEIRGFPSPNTGMRIQ